MTIDWEREGHRLQPNEVHEGWLNGHDAYRTQCECGIYSPMTYTPQEAIEFMRWEHLVRALYDKQYLFEEE